jgi:hypothetical protein
MAMDSSAGGQRRRVEVHFASDDAAIVLEVSEDPDGSQVEDLIGILEARNIDDAERRLDGSGSGLRATGRINPSNHR